SAPQPPAHLVHYAPNDVDGVVVEALHLLAAVGGEVDQPPLGEHLQVAPLVHVHGEGRLVHGGDDFLQHLRQLALRPQAGVVDVEGVLMEAVVGEEHHELFGGVLVLAPAHVAVEAAVQHQLLAEVAGLRQAPVVEVVDAGVVEAQENVVGRQPVGLRVLLHAQHFSGAHRRLGLLKLLAPRLLFLLLVFLGLGRLKQVLQILPPAAPRPQLEQVAPDRGAHELLGRHQLPLLPHHFRLQHDHLQLVLQLGVPLGERGQP
ncbi:hypothetical protein HUJ04_000289, partial [Dendroctonus ponderosae]